MKKLETQNNRNDPWADFFLNRLIGSSSAIRLINSGCEWIREISGKTNFVFFGYELDTTALSKNYLKPLDSQLSIVKIFAGGCALREKCHKYFYPEEGNWNSLKESKFNSLLELIEQIFKTIADFSGGIQFVSTFGSIVLSPYAHTFGLAKIFFSIGSGFLTIGLRVSKIWNSLQRKNIQKEDCLENLGNIAMIVAQIFSIQLNVFGAYSSAFKDVLSKDKQIPSFVFNFWGTCASLLLLTYSGIEYSRGK